MISLIKKRITDKSSLEVSLFLFILSSVLLLLRFAFTLSTNYWFLGWNLFLAGLPYFFSFIIYKFNLGKKYSVKLFFLLLAWLAFYPNSPYIFVDLRHVGYVSDIPVGFDWALTFLHAFVGAFLGFESIVLLRSVLYKILNVRLGLLVLSINLLAGFGVYLGLVLRFNSWDILLNPLGLIATIVILLTNQADLIRILVFTLGYATLTQALFGIYYIFRKID